jgi:predicted Zn-dependent protease with MMP-like domain
VARGLRSAGFDVPIEAPRRLVVEAINSLPPEFALAMDNVAITVEEVAGDEIANGQAIFDVYIGVPLTTRLRWNIQPDKILI